MPTADYCISCNCLLFCTIVLNHLLRLKLPRQSWQSVCGYYPTSRAGPKSGNACTCRRISFPLFAHTYLYRAQCVILYSSIKCGLTAHSLCVCVLVMTLEKPDNSGRYLWLLQLLNWLASSLPVWWYVEWLTWWKVPDGWPHFSFHSLTQCTVVAPSPLGISSYWADWAVSVSCLPLRRYYYCTVMTNPIFCDCTIIAKWRWGVLAHGTSSVSPCYNSAPLGLSEPTTPHMWVSACEVITLLLSRLFNGTPSFFSTQATYVLTYLPSCFWLLWRVLAAAAQVDTPLSIGVRCALHLMVL